jgi:formylglycine-generating enzyme required for sulfatase activity
LQLLRWQARTQVFYEELGHGARLTMVRIPAGSFQMGSADQELGRKANEGPMHEVTLDEFLIGQTPITQAQWRAVAGWQVRPGERWGRELNPEPSKFQGEEARLLAGEANTDRRPVERVSWLEAMEFCSRLSQRTKRNYSLPSEAQWEYACRAGTTTQFHFGHLIYSDVANFNGSHASRFDQLDAPDPQPQWRNQTTPVGMFPANAWGLHDMHGNVWEWCLDHMHDSYEGAPCDGSAWVDSEAPKELRKINRGGSWYMPQRHCRSAFRSLARPNVPDGPYDDGGFRVSCLPPGTKLNYVDSLAPELHKHIDNSLELSDETRTMPTRVYFSYSHADVKWLKMLQKHLAPMVRDGLIVWNDELSKPGAMWSDEIGKALADAKVVILLVSPNLLASEFFASYELPQLLKAADEKDISLLWFLVEDCIYKDTDIPNVQPVLDPTFPLSMLTDMGLNKALSAVSQAIFNAIKYD